MIGVKKKADRTQIELLSIDDLVPKNHLVRKLDAANDSIYIWHPLNETNLKRN